jgi:RNA 2',3'-cyclic 3'-phosphodiesterase
MRAFIAIDLDPTIKATLAEFIQRLKKINGRDVSWSGIDGLHLTLKFLGEISEAKADEAKRALAGVTIQVRPFPLVLKGTGVFPSNSKFIRVLWAGVFEQPNLMNLHREVDFAMGKLGFLSESQPFHPHLTLGRVRTAIHLHDILDELDRYKYSSFGQMTAAKVTLFESQLKPEGAEYRVIQEFPLT